MRTYWAARSGNPGEWAGIDLGSTKNVRAVQLNYTTIKRFNTTVPWIFITNTVFLLPKTEKRMDIGHRQERQ